MLKLVAALVLGTLALCASAAARYTVAAQLERFFPVGLNNAGQMSADRMARLSRSRPAS